MLRLLSRLTTTPCAFTLPFENNSYSSCAANRTTVSLTNSPCDASDMRTEHDGRITVLAEATRVGQHPRWARMLGITDDQLAEIEAAYDAGTKVADATFDRGIGVGLGGLAEQLGRDQATVRAARDGANVAIAAKTSDPGVIAERFVDPLDVRHDNNPRRDCVRVKPFEQPSRRLRSARHVHPH